MSSKKSIKPFRALILGNSPGMDIVEKHTLIQIATEEIRLSPDVFDFKTIQRSDGKFEHSIEIKIFV